MKQRVMSLFLRRTLPPLSALVYLGAPALAQKSFIRTEAPASTQSKSATVAASKAVTVAVSKVSTNTTSKTTSNTPSNTTSKPAVKTPSMASPSTEILLRAPMDSFADATDPPQQLVQATGTLRSDNTPPPALIRQQSSELPLSAQRQSFNQQQQFNQQQPFNQSLIQQQPLNQRRRLSQPQSSAQTANSQIINQQSLKTQPSIDLANGQPTQAPSISKFANVPPNFSATTTVLQPRIAVPLGTPVSVPPVLNLPVLAKQAPLPRLRRPRVALALGGGGVRGAAHVGVLRVFAQAGIPVDIIAGTSMGAIVGGLYSAGIDISTIEKKFDDGSLMKAFMDVPLKVSIATAPVRAVPRTLTRNNYDGLYTGAKFRKYLDQTVPAFDQYIENFNIPFAAVAVDLVDGKPYALSRGKLGAILQASSAVPALREPVKIGNQLFIDGGVVDNIPVSVARDMGGDIVIAVNVDETFEKAPMSDFKPIGSVARRMVALQLATHDAAQLQMADIVIHPHVDGIGLITTKPRDARQAIRAGEQAAWNAIPYIKAKLAQVSTSLAGAPATVDGLSK